MIRRRLHVPWNVDGLTRKLVPIWQEIPQKTIRRNRSTCWTKPSNCDADMSSLDTGRNNGLTGPIEPPCCSTGCNDSRIVRMAVMDHVATSRSIAQQVQSVTHHLMSVRTIRRRLQYSGMTTRYPLLHLPLTGNHRRLRHQWCDEWWTWTMEWSIMFTDESASAATSRWSDSSLETQW
ncbi:transposable element Tcb1 transposase [Trichonephila clavipes]|uniref:Transposable element Tcb1 transposase n=1 Tax=Trichonephila clavipes TaxID=2585209 RepID=A0A8X6WL97_TRICX|nr:transposable element Tcb1 transposase [Trichonephila clavipes]